MRPLRCSKNERCRFRHTPRKLVWAALFDKDDRVARAVAVRYLYGTQTKPLGKLSTYDQFRRLHPDAALRGAVVTARTVRTAGESKKALVAVKVLWAKGLHSPGLAEVYAAIEEDNATGLPLTEVSTRARDVCDEALKEDDGGASWARRRGRCTRLERRLNRAIRPPPENPRNTRPAHKSRSVRP